MQCLCVVVTGACTVTATWEEVTTKSGFVVRYQLFEGLFTVLFTCPLLIFLSETNTSTILNILHISFSHDILHFDCILI